MKKLTIILILAVLVLGAVFMAANEWPARLRVINKSEMGVVINLGVPYQYLYVAPGGEQTFTIEKDLYNATVWWCDQEGGRTMDLNHNLRLNFTSCGNMPVTKGERTMEKVDFNMDPKRDFHFQY
jgi:hypothetical protein